MKKNLLLLLTLLFFMSSFCQVPMSIIDQKTDPHSSISVLGSNEISPEITSPSGNPAGELVSLGNPQWVSHDYSVTGDTLLTNSRNVQVINIPQGWSSLSGYVLPDNTDIVALFESLINQLIIVQNQQGIYWPDNQVNTLLSWDQFSGYVIKLNQAANLELSGQEVIVKTINLEAGWNLIPVLSSCPVSVTDLLISSEVVIAKEVAGLNLFWPQMGINTLLELLPGNSYFVLVNSPLQITFPDCPPTVWTCGDPINDPRDNQVYNTIQIGDQCWMAENVNVGTMIDGSINQTNNAVFEKHCYENNPSNCDIYGGLYQWGEMMQGICPAGWHLPGEGDWGWLATILAGEAGGKMKTTGTIEEGTGLWHAPNTAATNSSGFSALPGGYKDEFGNFAHLGSSAFFFSTLPWWYCCAHFWQLNYNGAELYSNWTYTSNSLSVRCLKD